MDAKKIKEELIRQKSSNFKGNIYYKTQISFAYNSNKIEGSKLTEDQTEAIFDTHSFIPKTNDLIKLDDLLEVKNHFKLFDYMLENIDNKLNKDMIIKMHYILKRGTSDEDNPLQNVGGFKKVPNIIKSLVQMPNYDIQIELNGRTNKGEEKTKLMTKPFDSNSCAEVIPYYNKNSKRTQ